MESERILVLQLKRIGDLILTLPALSALRESRPDARITVILADACGQLSPILPGVDRVFIYRRGASNASLWMHLLFSKYDIALDFTGTDRSILMAALSKSKQRVSYEKLAGKKAWRRKIFNVLSDASLRDLHTVDYHLALLKEIGILAPPRNPRIDIPAHIDARTDLCLESHGIDKEYAIIHPGTARVEKYWPAERWVSVVRHLLSKGLAVVMTGSSDAEEQAELDKIRADAPEALVDLSGKFNLVELSAIIRRARVALGVDSAAMHLANAFRVPQIALFGPTNPYHWKPRHDRALVLLAGESMPLTDYQPKHRERGMSELSTDSVIHAIDSLLSSDEKDFT